MLVVLLTFSAVYYFGSTDQAPADFSWISYLDMNPDLGQRSYSEAVGNYLVHGSKRGRPYKEIAPSEQEIDIAKAKIKKYISGACPSRQHDASTQNLIIYRLSKYNENAYDVARLNLELFLSTIDRDPCKSTQSAFYLFNIIDEPRRLNQLTSLIPTDYPHIATLHWPQKHGGDDNYNHLRTMEILGRDSLFYFCAIFLLHIGVRGPLGARSNNAWINTYRNLLDLNDVALVSPVLSCSEDLTPQPVVHGYAVSFRTTFAYRLLDAFAELKMRPEKSNAIYTKELANLFGAGATTSLAGKHGLNVAGIAQFKLGELGYYDNNCNAAAAAKRKGSLPYASYTHGAWCGLDIAELIFVPWDGHHIAMDEYRCANAKNTMRAYLTAFAQDAREVQTAAASVLLGGSNTGSSGSGTGGSSDGAAFMRRIDPYETVYVDIIRDMLVQYTEEERREQQEHQHQRAVGLSLPSVGAGAAGSSGALSSVTSQKQQDDHSVCFLVRTSAMHDSLEAQGGPPPELGSKFEEIDVFGFIKSKCE